MYTIMSSRNSDCFPSSFLTCIHFISFSCLIGVARASNTMLNRSGETTEENSVEFPQKTKNGNTFWPGNSSAGIIPQESWNTNLKEPMHSQFIAAQFTITKFWKQPKSPSVNEWIKKLWHIYIQQKERRSSYPFATAGMELESIMLSEISQAMRDKYHLIHL